VLIFLLFCVWTEDFETQEFFPPDDWIVVNEDALDACWYREANAGHSGVYSATCYGDTAYSGLSFTNLDYLITPQLFPQPGDSLVGLWCRGTSPSVCTLDVMISSASPPSMSSFDILYTVPVMDTNWTYFTFALNSFIGVPVFVAFRVRSVVTGEQVYLDDISLPEMTQQPFICNGRMRTKGSPSQKYLKVWGSHYEMGYAQGYLLAEEAMANMIRFAVGNSSNHMVSPIEYEYFVRPYFNQQFVISQKYQDEAQGAYDGCVAKGVDLTHPALGRDIVVEDILCLSAMCDFNVFGCSSISGWGESTDIDDTLQGGLVIARDLDYRSGQYTCIGNTSVIIAYEPDDLDEQPFVAVTIAGLIGCLSGVNREGVGLCCDYGNHRDTSYIPPHSLVPFSMACRNALESVDPDSNGIDDIFDLVHAIRDSSSLTCWDVHLFSPYDATHQVPAAILEINNVGDSLRYVTDNILSPQINSDWNIAVTNHERVLYPPVYCYRYQSMADSINADFHITTSRAVAIENAVAGWSSFAGTIHLMVFRANVIKEHPDWPSIGVSYAYRNEGAHVHKIHFYSWSELFDGTTDVCETNRPVVQQQKIQATILSGPLCMPPGVRFTVFDITGRAVDPQHIARGIYFIEIDEQIRIKVIKIR
jgi:hypothetical protein